VMIDSSLLIVMLHLLVMLVPHAWRFGGTERGHQRGGGR
jgi:hypothetical protein